VPAWEYIDHECVPDDDGTLYLMNRGAEYAIHVNGYELMGSGLHGSEDALADLACDRVARLDDARVLVGGLGMGFTLAAVLRRLGPAGQATVSELMPAVVRWHAGPMGSAASFPLQDPRVVVHMGDVGELVERPPAPWSAILLDVDNGPRALTRPHNGWLYTDNGLRSARAALIPGGILGIWSADPDDSLTHRLQRAGFEVEVLRHVEPGRATDDDSCAHVLWMARRPCAS
jgi:spermidine synthase